MSTTASPSPVKVLSDHESRRYLAAADLGRLIVRKGQDIDIFPVNFVLDSSEHDEFGGDLYVLTAEGAKLTAVLDNPDVVFEVDEVGTDTTWSVVVRGKARVLKSEEEIAHAESLPLRPYIPTRKTNWLRIEPESLSGREFLIGDGV